jgi:hypothetical protein
VRRTPVSRRASLLAALLSLYLAAPATAIAGPSATLSAAFVPLRLGHRTTLSFAFSISAGGALPPPLTGVRLSYPANLGIGLSGLGLATCGETELQALGPAGCPANAIMGYGAARAELALGPNVVGESAPITILRAPDSEGHIALLLYATGTTPVAARAVLPGVLLAAPAPFGGLVSIAVPLIASVPGAPDVALVRLRATLGPAGVTYFESVAHQTLAYRPTGILLPATCPRGGFPFAAELSFADGSAASAHTAVPCPAHRHRVGRPQR